MNNKTNQDEPTNFGCMYKSLQQIPRDENVKLVILNEPAEILGVPPWSSKWKMQTHDYFGGECLVLKSKTIEERVSLEVKEINGEKVKTPTYFRMPKATYNKIMKALAEQPPPDPFADLKGGE